MSAKRARVKRIQPTSDTRVTRALELLGMLSAADGGIVDAQAACQHLGCTEAELDVSIALIATLADRESGARAIIYRDHRDIVLEGDAAQLLPLRLTAGEGAVLAYLLDDLALPAEVRGRLEQALLPPAWKPGAERAFASTAARGPWVAPLLHACQAGHRCRLSYRSQSEELPRERAVDPVRIEAGDDVLYLVARDIDHNDLRRYRLDRIAALTETDESIDRAAVTQLSVTPLAESLGAEELVATVAVAAGTAVPDWAGIIEAAPEPDGDATLVTVRVSAKPWLFDQVLSAAGALRIVAPDALVDEFIDYANGLL